MKNRWLLATILALGCCAAAWSPLLGGARRGADRTGAADAVAGLKPFETRYYIIHTDLEGDDVRESALRMTKMAEEYHERTSEFSGTINQKLPFYLFKSAEDYYASGAPQGSAGVFTGDKLMAVAGEKLDVRTWHVVQHEGFHQFAHAVIRGQLPVWVNEGLAEYFGESVFTGDGFVTGVIPTWRLQRIKQSIEQKRFKSIQAMMKLSLREWNGRLALENYDQAWSMVQFLAHGENGKYQKAFSGYMNALGRGVGSQAAWQQSFGGDVAGFEPKWQQFWLNLSDDPTAALYAQATAGTLSSFLARAVSQKQSFDSMDEFVKAGGEGKLKSGKEDWLPPALLEGALKSMGEHGVTWTLETGTNKQPRIVGTLADKTRLVSGYTVRGGKVTKVGVDIDDLAKTVDESRKLIEGGKKTDARSMLQTALRKHPDSPAAEDARKLVLETK